MTPAEWLLVIATACQTTSGYTYPSIALKEQLTCQQTLTKCVLSNTTKVSLEGLWTSCLEKAK